MYVSKFKDWKSIAETQGWKGLTGLSGLKKTKILSDA